MTGRIISLHGDEHDEIGRLLPWYVTGRLDAGECARVEAHLKTCAACQADLDAERRLHALVAGSGDEDEDSAMDAAWARMKDRPARRPVQAGASGWRSSPAWMRGLMAAQFALLVIGAGWIAHALLQPRAEPQYHALSAPAAAPRGNVIVVFSPDTSERRMRELLRTGHARLVDGPTAADAYILSVPDGGRGAALLALRADKAVVVAEPIDGDGQ